MAQDGSIHRACPGQDIISEIPDMIRLHILTLLPRKYAVRTGVLSTKWKDLWKHRFPHPTTLTFGRATETDEDQNQLAKEIQVNMTKHGKKKIETYNLYFYPGKNHEQMASEWVEQAVTNGAEEFHLDFSQDGMGHYPSKQIARRAKKIELKESLFKCNKALTTLSLTYCRMQRYFKFKHFSCLETLCLNQVNINDFMFEKLVSNCKGLEKLELWQCLRLKHIQIGGNKLERLKKLTIAYCCRTKHIHISAPMLQTFYFYGKFPDSFVMFYNMPFLSDVILASPSKYVYQFRYMDIKALVFMWLDQMQVLTLSRGSLQFMFGSGSATWVIYEHLKELQLLMDGMKYSDLNNIYCLFKHCELPLLESLYIELPTTWFAYDNGDSLDLGYGCNSQNKQKNPPNIIFKHLKTIKMNNFKGYLSEIMLLEFLLRSAINLERIILVLSHGFEVVSANTIRELQSLVLKLKAFTRAQAKMLEADKDDFVYKAAHSNVIWEFKNQEDKILKD